MQIQAGYVVQVSLEASHPTETFLSWVQVVAEHHRKTIGVIGSPGRDWIQQNDSVYVSYKFTKFWSQQMPNSCRVMAMQREWSRQSSDPYQAAPLESAWPGYHMQMDNDKKHLLSAPIIQIDWLSGGRGHVKYTIIDGHSLVLCPDPIHPAHVRRRVRVRAESGHETRHCCGQTVY